jgi:hypothetical protein
MLARNLTFALASALLLTVGASWDAARAATCTDPIDISLNVVGDPSGTNSGCELGSTDNDNPPPRPGRVNADTMFNFADWLWAGTDNGLNGVDEPGTVNIALALTGDTKEGDWSISSTVFNVYEMVMLVFKGSNAPDTIPDSYVGYLLKSVDGTSGTYVTPFSKDGKLQDISHVSAYVRGVGSCPSGNCSPTEVPLPAGILLLISALGGLGFLARFRKAGAAA